MRLIKGENICSIDSFAMLLDVDPEWLIHTIGHDGTRKHGEHRIGFHMQEFILVCLGLGYALTPIDVQPLSLLPSGEEVAPPIPKDRILQIMKSSKGVLEGRTSRCGHMCAWDKVVFDPRGECYTLGARKQYDFDFDTFWLLNRLP